jgi:hypothetical protein
MCRRQSPGFAEFLVIEVGVEIDQAEKINSLHPLSPRDILPQGFVYGFPFCAVMAESLCLLE